MVLGKGCDWQCQARHTLDITQESDTPVRPCACCREIFNPEYLLFPAKRPEICGPMLSTTTWNMVGLGLSGGLLEQS